MTLKENPRILVVKPSSLGDIFHVFPALALIRRHYPQATFDWLVNPVFADAVDFCPQVEKKIFFPRRELGSLKTFLPSLTKLLYTLRSCKYDLIIDFQGLFRSGFFSFMAKGGNCGGFASPREKIAAFYYNRKVVVPEHAVHAVERNVALAAGLLDLEYTVPHLELPVVDRFRYRAEELLRAGRIQRGEAFIAVVPGARWVSKRWSDEFFIELLQKLDRKLSGDVKFVILGSFGDFNTGQKIVAALPERRAFSLAGLTGIGELVELIRHSLFMISNDSGPIHIASALRKKVYALFGPTCPERTGPYGEEHRIFRRGDLDCLGCLCRECPGGNYLCHELNTDEVVRAIMKESDLEEDV